MRLICPNCDAQYDIDDDVIPQGGRDVECSNCSHTWFQTNTAKAPAGIMSRAIPTPLEHEVEPELETDIEPILETDIEPVLESDIEPEFESDIEPVLESDDEPAYEAAAPVRPKLPTRKPLDSSIADILRQESGLAQTEPDRATPATAEMDQAARTRGRISQLTNEEDAAPPEPAVADTPNNSRLRTIPSIDEINANLRAQTEGRNTPAQKAIAQEQAGQRRGFRRGFAMMLVLIGLAITPYFFVDQIVERAPQSRGFMEQYVQTVDQIRVQLRDVTTEVTVQVRALVAEYLPSDAEPPALVETAPVAPVETAPIAPAEPAEPETVAPTEG